jgi:hypothetical protein
MARTKTERQKYLDDLTACGWFEGVPAEVHALLKKRIISCKYDDVWNAAIAFDIDPECIYEEGAAYTKLLKEFARASGGLFSPVRITEKWGGKKATVEFSHKGRKYSAQLSIDSDWADTAIIRLVQKAIKDSGAPVNFVEVSVPGGGQEILFALTTPAVVKRAKDLRLLPSRLTQRAKEREIAVERRRTFHGVDNLNFSKDGRIVYIQSGSQLWTWLPYDDGQPLKFAEDPKVITSRMVILPDNRFFFTNTSSAIFWDPESKTADSLFRYKSNEYKLHSVATPDGNVVVTNQWFYNQPSVVQTWDVASRQLLHSWPASNERLNSLILSPDGTQIAANSREQRFTIWTINGEKLREWDAPGWARGMAWHPGRNAIASITEKISFWETNSGKLIADCEYKYIAQRAQVFCAFAPDGSYILTWGGSDGCVSQYEFPSGKLLATRELHQKYSA